MQASSQLPPRRSESDTIISTYSANSSLTTSTMGTSRTSDTTETSSLHPSDTNYGATSLMTYTGDDIGNFDLTPEEQKWVEAAHAFAKTEQPFREQKTSKTVRKLKVWHPKRPLKWSFLRRLYNGRQDLKEEEAAEKEEVNCAKV